jgi:hypothetical protein
MNNFIEKLYIGQIVYVIDDENDWEYKVINGINSETGLALDSCLIHFELTQEEVTKRNLEKNLFFTQEEAIVSLIIRIEDWGSQFSTNKELLEFLFNGTLFMGVSQKRREHLKRLIFERFDVNL